jgi:hypothetical protein
MVMYSKRQQKKPSEALNVLGGRLPKNSGEPPQGADETWLSAWRWANVSCVERFLILVQQRGEAIVDPPQADYLQAS